MSGLFTDRLTTLPEALKPSGAIPPAGDRETWAGLPEDIAARLVASGETALSEPWHILPATTYLDYVRNGNRTRFEELYFARRRKLNALVLAECVEQSGRFLDGIIDGIFLLCEESGWQLPAHNSYVRGGSRLALPDNSRPVIDLFAAETGAQLAVLASLLGDELDRVSPEIKARIDREIEERILTPYLSSHFWWMGNGDEPMNNWTAWCTQNILLAAVSRPIPEERRRAVVIKAAGSLDAFLKDYGDDGACEEGALYYRHAGLCLFNALNILADIAPDAFEGLWQQPKIRNIAEYILHAHVADQRYFNFADCSAVTERCGAREFLFGLATGSDLLADFAAQDWSRDEAPDQPDEINLFYRVQGALTAGAMRERASGNIVKPDIYYPSIGLMIARDERFALAVKAGDNGDSHNHNDVGSFTIYKEGKPFLIDVGVESYTAKTFSPNRYDIWTMQSAYHNLPTSGGVIQRDGEAYAARDVAVSLTPTEARMEMDIAGAYPAEAALRSYHRTVRLLKGEAIEIEDVADGDLPITLSLMFAERPLLTAGTIILGNLGQVFFSGADMPELEEIEITDPRLRKAWPQHLYRVLLPFSGRRLHLTVV
ncbi:heparinase II/III family protein [Rhizobium sp. RU36D]|uniref:heparinase II/III domain-containing protein n=1 Tax=Rhizobium sp. RU36D TaxID=1907415 RepID=UPI0009D7FF34|nr:heparinase II/III family protein [Rhizobium sp. RU36D]SMD01235.1 Heparinase II/III-like protein [Rhizobium sp. RU36D]